MKKILLLLTLVSSLFAVENKKMVVYKSPSCGCCHAWSEIMKKKGFNIEEVNVPDISFIKQKLGLKQNQISCHTAVVDGYVIEGHVDFEAIKKMLDEKPNIKGLSVPGMPIGSPGMEQGSLKEKYDVLYINKDGTQGVYSWRK